MELAVFNIQGKEVKKCNVPDSVFGLDVKDHVLAQVVKAYQANRRQGTHATKTRSTISGGGKKPYRQKGTGNARQGSSRSLIMEGGAVAHGPQPRSYRQGMNKKLKRLALKVALSDKARHNGLFIVDDFSISNYSTKHIVGAIAAFKQTSALISDERKDDIVYKSTRNIHRAAAIAPGDMNAEDVLRHKSLIISETALNALCQRLEEKQ